MQWSSQSSCSKKLERTFANPSDHEWLLVQSPRPHNRPKPAKYVQQSIPIHCVQTRTTYWPVKTIPSQYIKAAYVQSDHSAAHKSVVPKPNLKNKQANCLRPFGSIHQTRLPLLARQANTYQSTKAQAKSVTPTTKSTLSNIAACWVVAQMVAYCLNLVAFSICSFCIVK